MFKKTEIANENGENLKLIANGETLVETRTTENDIQETIDEASEPDMVNFKAANDNDLNDPDPDSPGSKSLGSEKSTFSKEEIDKAVIKYKLGAMMATVPPADFKKSSATSLEESINKLKYELLLSRFLKEIKKRPGAKPGKGIPSKKAVVEALYGLTPYACKQIEALDEEWVNKAIIFARKNGELATRTLALRLKREDKKEKDRAKAEKMREERNKAFQAKIENGSKAEEGKLFDGAVVDLTQCQPEEWEKTQSLPLAEDALVFVATTPDTLPQALELIKSWGLTYADHVVWNRDRIKGKYKWSKNQHTTILIATKGNLPDPIDAFKLKSIHFDHQDPAQTDLPDYFFSAMENLFPGGNFLEVFSARLFGNQWAILGVKGGENV